LRRAPLACSAAAAAAVLVYLNALHNPFVYDDYHTVVANASIDRLGDLRAIVLHDMTRPLVNLSYAFDRRLWGMSPEGFHAASIALHAFAVVLLFTVARRFYADPRPVAASDGAVPESRTDTNSRATVMAFAAAALLAVHPMMTEAVGYISGRSELLCAVFFLLAVMAGVRWLRGDGTRWAAATVVLWSLSLATKELGAMFPFVLVAYDELVIGPTREERRRRWRTIHLPLIAIAAAAGLARIAILTRVESPGEAAVHWPYALVALEAIRRYVLLLVNPHGQTIFHEVGGFSGIGEPRALLAVVSVMALALFAWSTRHRSRVAAFGVVWFLLLLAPSAALTMLDQGEPMAEHRVYLASCGLFLAAGDGVGRLRDWSLRTGGWAGALVPVGLTVALVGLAVQTVARNEMWRSPIALWQESVTLAPKHYRPRLLLGEALQEAGRRDDAIAEYKTAIQLRPKDPTGHVKLAAVLVTMGRTEEARQEFSRVLELDPRNAAALRALQFLDRFEGGHADDDGRR
jgi:protein O-mannosyl-transferase